MQVYRAGNPLIEIEIDKRTTFSHRMHGEHIVTAVTVTESPVGIEIGDYIEHKGQIFEVNQPIQTTKTGKFTYENTITFESYLYRLYNKVFMHQGAIEFAFLGTAQMYAQLIIDNMNEIDPGWTLGVIESTEDLPISFFAGAEGYSCRTALTLIAERFGLEYIVVNKTINLQKTAGRDTNYDFEVGMTKGLYSLTRKPLDDLKIINRIYPFGSTRNIPEGYRNGAKRLTIDGGFVERPLEPGEIRREGAIVLDDEYPNRTGTITAVSADGLTFTDPTLFDLNGQAIDGVKQQVVFKTGFLSGEELDIAKYDDDTKEITLTPLVRENGSQVPDSTFSISVGDTYTLVGIKMPNLYVEQAESRLLARANEILSLPKNPTYELSIDEKYVRSNTILIELGDRINIRDEEMGIDTNIRVTSISYPIINEAEITCQVSDEIPYTIVERVLKENSETKQEIVTVDRNRSEQARRGWLDVRHLQTAVFDPDGYFNPENIKPFTIETYMLSVGAKSQNFGLNNVVIDPNTGGNPNMLSITAGQLIHYEVQIEGVGYIWSMAQRTFSSLDPAKHYYLFARCSKSNLSGTWEISDAPVMTNDPTYPDSWNFLLGIIHPVSNGYRNHSLTNGMTVIVGDTIKTGRIKSPDGLNYFDLTDNKFKLGNNASGIDWNVTTPNTLTIRGGLVQNEGGAVSPIGVDRGTWAPYPVVYYPGDRVFWAGGTWRYAGMTPSTTGEPGVYSIWVPFAEAGADGEDGITITLSPSGYVFKGSETSALPDGLIVNVQARRDTTSLPVSISQVGSSPLGMTVNISGSNISISVNTLFTSASGLLTFNVATGGNVFTQYFSYAIAFKGADGADGADGEDGAAGPRGPSLAYQGWYNASTQYYGNDLRIDAVRYGASYYFARPDAPVSPFSGILPTNTNYWTNAGATFESIATGLLLAELAYITNLGARYIQTDVIGQKRIEINERRERKDSSGAGTGLWVDQNNIALFNSSNQKLLEMDDDSSPGLGIFYLEFNTSISFINFRGSRREWDHSAFNANFVGTNNPAWAHGNFANGFPRFVLDLISSNVGGNYRYYFRYPTQGFNASDPNDDNNLLPNTSVGNNVSNLNNTNLIGSIARGYTRIYPAEGSSSLDSGFFANDSDIIFTSGSNFTFTMPSFASGGYLTTAVGTNHIGRIVTFINKGSGLATISSAESNRFIDSTWTDVSSISVNTGETVVLKLISKTSVPTSINSWRWCVIKRTWN